MPDRPPLRARDRLFPMGHRTYVMAILNLTADSFSGDGTGGDLDAAVRHAATALAEGADIIDIGGESARADVPPRDPAQEADLVARAVGRIADETGATISVDTYKRQVAEAALDAGAHMINDIGGALHDRGAAAAAGRRGAAYVLNYTLEPPKVRPASPPVYDDLVGAHLRFLRDQMLVARDAGVAAGSLVIDPGIAFGKSHDEDLEILRRLSEFTALGAPLLLAASRKHFIGSVTGLPPRDRDEATAAITALSIAAGADIVRVHNVRANVRAARMADAIVRGRARDYAASAESWPWAADAAAAPGTRIGELGDAGEA